jgi:hypothetical protein
MSNILLVDLDKDYIRRSEIRHTRDLFAESVDNLNNDMLAWSADSGIQLKLNVVNEIDSQGAVSRTCTRVYAEAEYNHDLSWIMLSLGKIKPATKMTYGEHRGWQFDFD